MHQTFEFYVSNYANDATHATDPSFFARTLLLDVWLKAPTTFADGGGVSPRTEQLTFRHQRTKAFNGNLQDWLLPWSRGFSKSIRSSDDKFDDGPRPGGSKLFTTYPSHNELKAPRKTYTWCSP